MTEVISMFSYTYHSSTYASNTSLMFNIKKLLTPIIFLNRVDSSGRKVASLDVDGVVKVWSFNPIMQTKATIMSKSPLLSLEWATKPDRLVRAYSFFSHFCITDESQ